MEPAQENSASGMLSKIAQEDCESPYAAMQPSTSFEWGPGGGTLMDRYMAEVRRFPVLPRKEQLRLATAYKAGDQKAGEKLLVSTLRYPVSIAYQYKAHRSKLMDLVQEGNKGLMEALKRFEPARGLSFLTYSKWWILCHIRNYLLKSYSGGVKVPESKLGRALRYNLTHKLWELEKLGFSKSEQIESVAKYYGTDPRTIENWEGLAGTTLSLNHQMGAEDSTSTWQDILPAETPNPEEVLLSGAAMSDQRKLLEFAMTKLTSQEQAVVRELFLKPDEVSPTMSSVGAALSLSRERVRQIRNRALERLQGVLSKLSEADREEALRPKPPVVVVLKEDAPTTPTPKLGLREFKAGLAAAAHQLKESSASLAPKKPRRSHKRKPKRTPMLKAAIGPTEETLDAATALGRSDERTGEPNDPDAVMFYLGCAKRPEWTEPIMQAYRAGRGTGTPN